MDGRIVKPPIALSEKVCASSVENLNQLLADTITLRDLYKKHTGRWLVTHSISTTKSKTTSETL